ncbi:MAG TPA: biopolymer transporter ExbD [bacterium]|nr:biopolymer transporter ExbD [bacterium]
MAVKIRRRKSSMGDEISTASMSDIAFLLLIFFLVSTIFAEEQGLPMQLPGAASETAQISQKNILNVNVEANNLVTLDGQAFQINAIEGEIRRRILGNPKLVIQVKLHPDSFYGTMVDVLDELHLAEATKISIKGMDVVQ